MAGYLAKAYYLGDGEDGVYFTVKKNPVGKFYVKAVVEDGTACHTEPLMVGGTYVTEKEAVKAGVEATIKWCRAHVCMDEVTANSILGLF